MNKSINLLVFIFVAMVQISIPLSMIYKKNQTEIKGTIFRFKTQPIDPADPFVGRYVDLRFDHDTVGVHNAKYFNSNQTIYVEIAQGVDSFAVIKDISSGPFTHTTHYVKAKVNYINGQSIFIKYPFDRFYMEETKAPEAEIYANKMLQDSLNFGYAEVFILNGDAVIKDVKINHRTIKAL